jgi:hypothetical protein
MARFKVYAEYATVLMIEVEAEDEDDAYFVAKSIDGGDWERLGDDDWQISMIEEVKNA